MRAYQASRGKARVDWNHQHSSPPFCKPNVRPTSVPFFIRDMDPVVHPRRRRRPSCNDAEPELSQVRTKRAETRRFYCRSIRTRTYVLLSFPYYPAPCWSPGKLRRRRNCWFFVYLSRPVMESWEAINKTRTKSTCILVAARFAVGWRLLWALLTGRLFSQGP